MELARKGGVSPNITLGPDIRFAWPYVFEKRPNDQGEDKYEVLLLIPKTNKKAIDLFNAAINAAIHRGYSGEMSESSTFKKGTKESALYTPLKDGDDKADEEYGAIFEGYMYCTARSTRRPTVVDVDMQQILDPDEFYSGCAGAVSLAVFPFNNKTQGVGVQLNHLMKISDGDRIGGGVLSVEDAFSEYAGRGLSRGRDDDERPVRGRTESRSRSRDAEDEYEYERRAARGSGAIHSYGRGGSDDPMFN